ncbi:uncharacterized protein BJ171DRAFT_621829 [Polychytrium aggregatum]|uniref:uncharacterized protein n=1 Tax=Polychytrium aggregatum TaxID=110093 RepID=UPI0022FF329B|nr:uncharacterized protein BJ171DRAFT_621829 [Polychytrium aggregatum]KAI9203936.1 hypothetical protein BJ171DRAFT_621829 [Polychytrium aggregatum]
MSSDNINASIRLPPSTRRRSSVAQDARAIARRRSSFGAESLSGHPRSVRMSTTNSHRNSIVDKIGSTPQTGGSTSDQPQDANIRSEVVVAIDKLKSTSRDSASMPKSTLDHQIPIENLKIEESQTSSTSPTAFFPRVHPILLHFNEGDLEVEYERYFMNHSLKSWRKALGALFLSALVGYLYLMARSPGDSDYFVSNYSDAIKGSVTIANIDASCPAGWFCLVCDPDQLCDVYNIYLDVAFLVIGVLLPYIGVLTASHKLRPSQRDHFIHLLSVFFITFVSVLGIIPGTVNILFLYASYIFLRVRFIYALNSIIVINVIFLLLNLSRFISPGSWNHTNIDIKTFVLCTITLIVSSGIILFTCHETEIFHRSKFLTAHQMQKANTKLTNQLKVIQNVFGSKVGDFDSPLEKCFMILRSMMADPTMGPHHLIAIGKVMDLLGSSNLLSPDIAGQLTEFMDPEQEVTSNAVPLTSCT